MHTKKEINLNEKKMERAITKIGSEIADANDIAEKIGELNSEGAEKLGEAQEDLEELYLSIEEIEQLKKQAPQSPHHPKKLKPNLHKPEEKP